ncbi:tail fiber domain-containing protein [Candidatus Poribacteria bacterium]|nr:tail fiber domain-containing protein [Candidatus Poribacteria bacterium]
MKTLFRTNRIFALSMSVFLLVGFWLYQTQAQQAKPGKEREVEVEIGAHDNAEPGGQGTAAPQPQYWKLLGNAIQSGYFLGTTNNLDLVFKTNKVEALRITTAGNIGIGTSSPLQKLHVLGDVLVDSGGGKGIFWRPDNTGHVLLLGNGTNTYLGNHEFKNGVGNVLNMIIQDGGNIGIGTTSPVEKLDVAGTIQMNSFKLPTNASAGHVLTSDASGVGSWKPAPGGGGIGGNGTANFIPKFTDATTLGNSSIYETNGTVAIGTTTPASSKLLHLSKPSFPELMMSSTGNAVNAKHVQLQVDGSGNLRLFPVDDTMSIQATGLTVDRSGSVGIGMTNPSHKLDVAGMIRSSSGGFTFPDGTVQITAATGSAGDGHSLDASDGDPKDVVYVNDVGDVRIGGQGLQKHLSVEEGSVSISAYDSDISLYAGYWLKIEGDDTVSLTARRRIYLDGTVGIGELNPSNILTVVKNSATDPIADAWTTYSSRRWKTNITPIENALGKVQRLRGVSYSWKADGKHDIGLIAEEVGEVIPEVVAYEENGQDAKSVDYARLVAVLIEAVKEQQKRIDVQNSELTEMKAKMAQFESALQKPKVAE